jgi:segregation and condensation protein A
VTDQARQSARLSAASEARVWEDELLATPNTAPVLSVEGFEGPLDWLLEMARAQKIDLAKLPILALIQSFANALEAALDRPGGGGSPLARWGDWTVMAASLTELRSRLLLPHDSPEAKQARRDAEAVRCRLLTREQMRGAAHWFDHQPQIGRDVFARGVAETHGAHRVGDLADLLRACLVLLRVPEAQAAAYRPRPPPFWRVADALAQFEKLLGARQKGRILNAFLPAIAKDAPDRTIRCRAAVASTLIAGLELSRAGVMTMEQDAPWSSIFLQSRQGKSTSGEDIKQAG